MHFLLPTNVKTGYGGRLSDKDRMYFVFKVYSGIERIITIVAIMPVIFQLVIVFSNFFLWICNLLSAKLAALDQFACIHLNHIVLNENLIHIQSPRRRGTDDIPGNIKGRCMTGAFKLVLFCNPGDRAS
jgi:hypothetical protein